MNMEFIKKEEIAIKFNCFRRFDLMDGIEQMLLIQIAKEFKYKILFFAYNGIIVEPII